MFRFRILILTLFLFGLFPSSPAASARAASVAGDCTRPVKTDCDPKLPLLQLAASQCRASHELAGCKAFAARMEEKTHQPFPLGSCASESFCEDPARFRQGCWAGIRETFHEYATVIQQGILRDRWLEACDQEADLSCKHLLLKAPELTGWRELPEKEREERLRGTSAFVLWENILQVRQSRELARSSRRVPLERELAMNEDELRRNRELFWSAVSAKVKELGIRYECYDTRKLAEIECQVAASFLVPTSSVRLIGKAFRLAGYAAELSEAGEGAGALKTRRPSGGPELVFSSTEQNQAWIDEAINGSRAEGKWLFMDVENSVLKKLNDTLKDKNLVTRLTNDYKLILSTKIEELSQRFPELKNLSYEDFKSGRFAFPAELKPMLREQLNGLYQEANQEFSRHVAELAALQGVAVTDPATWFLGGTGKTADQANAAARYARKGSGTPRLRDFDDPEVRRNLTTAYQYGRYYESMLQMQLAGTKLLEPIVGRPGTSLLSKDVFGLVREFSNPEDLRAALQKTYGRDFSPDLIENIRIYCEIVNEFEPGVWIPRRKIANLDQAGKGGISADFRGLGARNARATAEGLSKARSLEEAVALAREGERALTVAFNAEKSDFQRLVRKTLQAPAPGQKEIRVRMACSGDDCVALPARKLELRHKVAVVDALAQEGNPGAYRISFIPEKVPEAIRTQLSVHGESIEKILRKELRGQMDVDKLQRLLFAVDMRTVEMNRGGVGLIIGRSQGIALTSEEEKLVRRAFRDSVEKMNDSLKRQGIDGKYEVSTWDGQAPAAPESRIRWTPIYVRGSGSTDSSGDHPSP